MYATKKEEHKSERCCDYSPTGHPKCIELMTEFCGYCAKMAIMNGRFILVRQMIEECGFAFNPPLVDVAVKNNDVKMMEYFYKHGMYPTNGAYQFAFRFRFHEMTALIEKHGAVICRPPLPPPYCYMEVSPFVVVYPVKPLLSDEEEEDKEEEKDNDVCIRL